MKLLDEAEIPSGRGITGDRYAGATHRHLTVQSASQLAEAEEEYGAPIDPLGTRRNITVSGGNVPLKPGTRFRLGPVQVEVVRVAAPCKLLEDELGRGAKLALHRRAGAVCRVLAGGTLTVGAAVGVVSPIP